MFKYKIVIEYDGTRFYGWQVQKNLSTIQGEIESALWQLTKKNITIYSASRTDSGVHALGQVAHFQLQKLYKTNEIQGALNHYLKDKQIVVINTKIVSPEFNARFSNKKKQYIYKIINRSSPLTLDSNRAWHIRSTLNISLMKEASQYLIGTFDFTSFRAARCQSKSPIKTLSNIEVIKKDNEISIIFDGTSFLYKQIRIIVGTLRDFGIKRNLPSYMKYILRGKNRKLSGETAPSCGLYLNKIFYN